VPSTPSLRDYFLHVFDATDGSKSDVMATVTETSTLATVTVHDGASTYVIDFAKTGAMGGHIKVTGAATCEQDLGANGAAGAVHRHAIRGEGGHRQGHGNRFRARRLDT